jgi:hypothetical protein
MTEHVLFLVLGAGAVLGAWDVACRFAKRNVVDPAEFEDLLERLALVEARPDLHARVVGLEQVQAKHGQTLTSQALKR